MVDAATSVSMLIVRGQVNKKDFAAALQSATGLLEVSRKSGNSALMESSEELMGGVLSGLERYPEALSHYEEAFRIARSIHENEPYFALHCAEVLWPMGRYNEAQNMLLIAHSGKNVRIASAVELLKTTILLSQERFAVVISHVDRAFSSKGSDAAPDDLPQFRLLRARAEARLGRVKEASEDMSALAEWVQKEGDEEIDHNIKLLQAEVYRKAGSPESAEPLAGAAYLYFLRLGKKESQWLSLLERARVQRSLGRIRESQESAKLALDILSEFEQTWPPVDYRSYTSRPDNKSALRELATYEGK
jgi:tetratricopeptide (TPR) repeat protein